MDPYGSLGTKSNFKREFWAANGQAFTSIQLYKAMLKAYSVLETMMQVESRNFNFEAVALCQQMNNVFLTCPSIE